MLWIAYIDRTFLKNGDYFEFAWGLNFDTSYGGTSNVLVGEVCMSIRTQVPQVLGPVKRISNNSHFESHIEEEAKVGTYQLVSDVSLSLARFFEVLLT